MKFAYVIKINLAEEYNMYSPAEKIINSMKNNSSKKCMPSDKYFLEKNLEKYSNINQTLNSFSNELGYSVVGKVRTLSNWKKSKKMRRIPILGFILSMFQFLFLRLLPKTWGFKKLYSSFGFSTNYYMSKAEILGRFIFNGYEIKSFEDEGLIIPFVLKKLKMPKIKIVRTGPIIVLDRLGYKGIPIKVYKIRTMHAYSEFLHKYMIDNHGFNNSGKILNDYRITKWGKLLRKYWIDEIPQIYNILRGDLKIIGLRPVSKEYFNELPEEVKRKRLTLKPGCIPPYVSLNMKSSVGEVLEADLIYIEAYEKNRLISIKFFFMAIYNIIFKSKRSS